MDTLVDCKRCGGNACYEQVITSPDSTEKATTHLCMGCGFTTSTLMVEGSAVVNTALESSPELYRDIKYKDVNGQVWLPATITLPGKGTVFVDGRNKNDWKWASIKAVPIDESEKSKFPAGQEFKMDMKSIQHFEQKEFMDALEQIGFFAL